MSGIYISGMEMPKEGSWKEIRIYPDGTCAIPNWQGDCTFIKGAKAIEVSNHGRLIDADAMPWIETKTIEDNIPVSILIKEQLESVPIIIPAEE